ncbi:MAG: hypothetical protein C0485_09895 [Pirellula sp.]|nr:hypothetical protein [Pirellula sp.]
MDLLALFRRAELLRERNRELREAIGLSIERAKAAEAERPDYDSIARETDLYADRRAHVCEDE